MLILIALIISKKTITHTSLLTFFTFHYLEKLKFPTNFWEEIMTLFMDHGIVISIQCLGISFGNKREPLGQREQAFKNHHEGYTVKPIQEEVAAQN